MGLTEATVVVAAAAVAVAAVALILTRSDHGQDPSGTRFRGGTGEPWLAAAGTVVREGRRIAVQAETLIHDDSPAAMGERAAVALERQLDDLTHQLASLTSSAPTAMDVRVCRSVAVGSRALSSALHRSSENTDVASGPTGRNQHDVIDRYSEFVTSLGDLERHIDLF